MQKKSGRKSLKSLLTTMMLGLALVIGLLGQSHQANAQGSIGLPDTTPTPEDMWGGGPVTPPSNGEMYHAVKKCIKDLGGNVATIDKMALAACILKELGLKTLDKNCDYICRIAFPDFFVHGDPCIQPPQYQRACSDCGDKNFMCCMLQDGMGAAAKCDTEHTKYEMMCPPI